MGGKQSATAAQKSSVGPYDKEIKDLFENLCDVGVLSRKKFQAHFKGPSSMVTKNLFERFFIDLLNSNASTKALFTERVMFILDAAHKSQDEQFCFYMDLLSEQSWSDDEKELERIIRECQRFGMFLADFGEETNIQNTEDVSETETSKIFNNQFSKTIINTSSKQNGSNIREKFISWCTVFCPKFFVGLQSWLLFKFTKNLSKGGMEMLPVPIECEASNLQLNANILWFLCCLLPSCYTRMENKYKVTEDDDEPEIDEHTKYTWNLLYDSNQHGLSLNRFKHKVMSYKSPTVTILEFAGGLKVILAIDEPWRDSPEKFGGHYCMFIEIEPFVKLIEANSKMVYLKELGRSIPTGILVGSETRPKMSISKDLSSADIYYKHLNGENIERIEVWGCGGVEAIKTQADMKKWERKEIEKRKKVKLPGQWDQDKTILEMGGVTVNHNQRGDI